MTLDLSRTRPGPFAAGGHLGLWPAAYAGAVMTCLARLGGIWHPTPACAAATLWVVLTTLGAYLLDRVKLVDALLDPADAQAQPARYAFLLAHSGAVRGTAAGALVSGAVAGLFVTKWAPFATLVSAAGVVAYAFRGRHAGLRPKDVIGFKNLYTAGGLTGFALCAALAAASPSDTFAAWFRLANAHAAALAAAFVFVVGRVTIDAALCDVDDAPTDARSGTMTIATLLGGRRLRAVAAATALALCAAVAFISVIPWPVRLRWVAAGVAGVASLMLIRPTRLRDFVDLRFPIETVACLLAASIF